MSQTPFFIPAARTTKEQAEVYEAICKFVAQNTGWDISDRKIFSIRYRHEGVEAIAQVGEGDIDGEIVLAILDSITYLVCTPNRGGIRGAPIMVGKDEVSDVTCVDDD